MSRPKRPCEGLSTDYDSDTLYRLNRYIYTEFQREHNATWWKPWTSRRWRRLGITHDVLNQLHTELRARGTLRTETTFSDPDDPEVQQVKL